MTDHMNIVFWIIAVVVFLFVIGLLLWGFIKLGIALVVVYIIFNVAFVWSSTDLLTNLKLDKILSREDSGKVSNYYGDYSTKRDEMAVLDKGAIAENVKTLLLDEAKQALHSAKDADKDVLITKLKIIVQDLSKDDAKAVLKAQEALLEKHDITVQEVLE